MSLKMQTNKQLPGANGEGALHRRNRLSDLLTRLAGMASRIFPT
jgi:hypothetical protein